MWRWAAGGMSLSHSLECAKCWDLGSRRSNHSNWPWRKQRDTAVIPFSTAASSSTGNQDHRWMCQHGVRLCKTSITKATKQNKQKNQKNTRREAAEMWLKQTKQIIWRMRSRQIPKRVAESRGPSYNNTVDRRSSLVQHETPPYTSSSQHHSADSV